MTFLRGELSVREIKTQEEGEYAYKTGLPINCNPYPLYNGYAYCRHNLWASGWKQAYRAKTNTLDS